MRGCILSRFTNWRKKRSPLFPKCVRNVAAWRKQRQVQRHVKTSARQYTKHDVGVKGSRIDVNRLSWDDIRVQTGVYTFSTPSPLSCASESTYVAGDGNCTWRALWMLSPIHSCWRVMKKRVLASYPQLNAFRPYGTHAGAEGIAAYAAYFCLRVHVHLQDSEVLFVPDLGVNRSVHLRILNHHAQPLEHTSAARARRHLECVRNNEEHDLSAWTPLAVSDVCTSNVEAGMIPAGDPVSNALILNYPRHRKRRVEISFNDEPNFPLFVDDRLDMDSIAAAIARHIGTCRQLVHIHVNGRFLRAVCATPSLSKQDKAFLWKLAVTTPLSRPCRVTMFPTLEAFAGHRATRARGLLNITSLIPPVILARAMRSLADALPGLPFSTVGVILTAASLNTSMRTIAVTLP
eukprot:6483166-Amphidinium_carterae.1